MKKFFLMLLLLCPLGLMAEKYVVFLKLDRHQEEKNYYDIHFMYILHPDRRDRGHLALSSLSELKQTFNLPLDDNMLKMAEPVGFERIIITTTTGAFLFAQTAGKALNSFNGNDYNSSITGCLSRAADDKDGMFSLKYSCFLDQQIIGKSGREVIKRIELSGDQSVALGRWYMLGQITDDREKIAVK